MFPEHRSGKPEKPTPAASRRLGVFFALGFFLLATFGVITKYFGVLYNALDLAIFSQTVHQSAFGNLFGLTIHPHAYLGDHASYGLLLLAPIYRLLGHPLTLLVLQAAVLASSVFPLSRIVRMYVHERTLHNVLLAAFFLHPFLHAYALFEFELLVWCVPIILWAIVAFVERRFRFFLVLLFALAIVREDLGLVLIGWSALAWVERRSFRWIALPAILGVLTVLAGGVVTSVVNGEQYKFLAYYGWIAGLPSQPLLIFSVLLRLQNILFLLVLLLLSGPFAWRRPALLLPASLPLLGILLLGTAPGMIELRTHYTALLFPFFLWASLATLQTWRERPRRVFAVLLVAAMTVYGYLTISPLRPTAVLSLTRSAFSSSSALARAIINEVRDDPSIAAGLRFLPHLTEKEGLYSMHYVARGTRQLSDRPSTIPDTVTTLLVDASDAVMAQAQYGGQERFTGSDDRVRELLAQKGFQLERMVDSFFLFRKRITTNVPLYERGVQAITSVASQPGAIQLLATSLTQNTLIPTKERVGTKDFSVLRFSLTWKKLVDDEKTYSLRFRFMDQRGRLATERYVPFAAGTFPTPAWPMNEPLTFPFSLLLPDIDDGTYGLAVELISFKGYLGLNDFLSAEPMFTTLETMSTYDLGTVNITERDTR